MRNGIAISEKNGGVGGQEEDGGGEALVIMELMAYLYQYQFQEEPKKTTELAGVPDSLTFHRAQHKISVPYPFSAKDSGVQARALKYSLSPSVNPLFFF